MRYSAHTFSVKQASCPACLRPRNSLPTLAQDRAGQSARSAFVRTRKIERKYVRQLRSVAKHVTDLVRGFDLEDIGVTPSIQSALDRYAAVLRPWAESVGRRMVTEVAQRDERSWFRVADRMGTALRQEIAAAPVGEVMRARQAEQVRLITSLPTEAAQRVHDMAREGIVKGWRADQIAAEIMRTGEVTRSRAEMIGRTEVGRTSTLLTQARAEHVGSTHYYWRSSDDGDVRPTHKALNGKIIAWNDPPECDPGHRAHAGAIFNCRCYAEPILDHL